MNMHLTEQDAIINEYKSLVRAIAHAFISRLPPSVDPNDLIQEGTIGLLEAHRKYTPEEGAKFSTYATHRIKGAMLDFLRKIDPISRDDRKGITELNATKSRLEQKIGRHPTDRETAKEMGIPLSEYFERLAIKHNSLSINLTTNGRNDDDEGYALIEIIPDNNAMNPLDILLDKERATLFAGALSSLAERTQYIVTQYLFYDRTMKDIGEELGVSESRISQIYADAIERCEIFVRRTHCWPKDNTPQNLEVSSAPPPKTTALSLTIVDSQPKSLPRWKKFTLPSIFEISAVHHLALAENLGKNPEGRHRINKEREVERPSFARFKIP